MSNEEKSKNPADIAAELIRKRAAEQGYELAEDFDQQVAEWREYLNEPVSPDQIDDDYFGRLTLRAMAAQPTATTYRHPDGTYEHVIEGPSDDPNFPKEIGADMASNLEKELADFIEEDEE